MAEPADPYVPALGIERLTAFYDPVVAFTTREATFKERLLAQARLLAGQRVLDLGCGTGTLAIAARRAQPCAEVHGVDADPAMLGRARRKATAAAVDVAFTQARAEALPFADRTFDAVLSTLFFHHLPAAPKARAIGEVVRVLRPGGAVHVADWGRPTSLALGALALLIRLVDGAEATRENLAGRLPAVLARHGLVDVRTHGTLATAFGSLAFLSARARGSPGAGPITTRSGPATSARWRRWST